MCDLAQLAVLPLNMLCVRVHKSACTLGESQGGICPPPHQVIGFYFLKCGSSYIATCVFTYSISAIFIPIKVLILSNGR